MKTVIITLELEIEKLKKLRISNHESRLPTFVQDSEIKQFEEAIKILNGFVRESVESFCKCNDNDNFPVIWTCSKCGKTLDLGQNDTEPT
jgi:hypothetical protein